LDTETNKSLITNLTEKKVGKVVEVETAIQGTGNFVRVRVRLDVRKPLARFVTVSRGGQKEFYQIKFEKIPKFCGACGLFGHTHMECGTGEHDEETLKWGDWLKADFETWKGRGPSGSRGGGRGGRDPAGRGRGRGFTGGRDVMVDVVGRGQNLSTSWRHNAIPYIEGSNLQDDSLKDTTNSPLKKGDIDMEEKEDVDSGAKRRLLLEDKESDEAQYEDGDGVAADMVTDSDKILDGVSEKDRKKRPKKTGADSSSLGSAGSLDEPVRAQ
jgi:hypothetical protein